MATAHSPHTIRPLRTDEWPALAALEQECFGAAGYSPYFVRMVPHLYGSTCLVAARGAELTGYALGALEQDRREQGWLLSVAVRPAAGGAGLGTRLTARCVEALEAAGARRVLLTVAPDNAPARRIYERLGFTTRRHEPDFFGPGQDRLVLCREGGGSRPLE